MNTNVFLDTLYSFGCLKNMHFISSHVLKKILQINQKNVKLDIFIPFYYEPRNAFANYFFEGFGTLLAWSMTFLS